jgi:hypothetical protein
MQYWDSSKDLELGQQVLSLLNHSPQLSRDKTLKWHIYFCSNSVPGPQPPAMEAEKLPQWNLKKRKDVW